MCNHKRSSIEIDIRLTDFLQLRTTKHSSLLSSLSFRIACAMSQSISIYSHGSYTRWSGSIQRNVIRKKRRESSSNSKPGSPWTRVRYAWEDLEIVLFSTRYENEIESISCIHCCYLGNFLLYASLLFFLTNEAGDFLSGNLRVHVREYGSTCRQTRYCKVSAQKNRREDK